MDKTHTDQLPTRTQLHWCRLGDLLEALMSGEETPAPREARYEAHLSVDNRELPAMKSKFLKIS